VAGPKSSGQGSNLSSTTVEIRLQCGARSSKKKLPRATTISAVKLLCSRLFKIPPDRQLLLLHQGGRGGEGVGGAGGAAGGGCGAGGGSGGGAMLAEPPEEIGGDDTQILGYFEPQVGGSLVTTEGYCCVACSNPILYSIKGMDALKGFSTF
jgi:hypothetical protein